MILASLLVTAVLWMSRATQSIHLKCLHYLFSLPSDFAPKQNDKKKKNKFHSISVKKFVLSSLLFARCPEIFSFQPQLSFSAPTSSHHHPLLFLKTFLRWVIRTDKGGKWCMSLANYNKVVFTPLRLLLSPAPSHHQCLPSACLSAPAFSTMGFEVWSLWFLLLQTAQQLVGRCVRFE